MACTDRGGRRIARLAPADGNVPRIGCANQAQAQRTSLPMNLATRSRRCPHPVQPGAVLSVPETLTFTSRVLAAPASQLVVIRPMCGRQVSVHQL